MLLYAANCSKFRKLSRTQNWKRSVFLLIPKTINAKKCSNYHVVVLQSLSCLGLFATPWIATLQAPVSFTISWSLLKFMTAESVMLSNRLILCCPLLLCLQSFPASGPFPMSCFFASGGQGIGVSASVLPMNSQGWFPLGLTDLISLPSKGLGKVFSSLTVQK